MSKSRRKIAIHGNTKAESDKTDKQLGNRRYRQHVSNNLNSLKGSKVTDEFLIDLEENLDFEEYEALVSDWGFNKDGKTSRTVKLKIIPDELYDMLSETMPNLWTQCIRKSDYDKLMRK